MMTSPEEGTRTAREFLEDLGRRIDDLQPLFERARVKVALGKAELRDKVQEVGKRIDETRRELKRLREEVREPTAEIRQDLEDLVDRVARSLERIIEG